MANENEVDIEIPDEEDFSGSDDTTDWKLKALELQRKHREAGIRNRERTKSLKDELATLKTDPRLKNSEKKEEKKSDDEVMKRLENMALKMSNITADDEVELYQRWKQETGRDADSILENKIFLAELENLRTAKINAIAADAKGDKGGESGTKGDPDYWIARATKNSEGELMFPDDLPKDFKLRAAIVEKMGASSKGKGQFYFQ